LQELSRFLTWPAHGDRRHSSRYLRQPHGQRGQRSSDKPQQPAVTPPPTELVTKE